MERKELIRSTLERLYAELESINEAMNKCENICSDEYKALLEASERVNKMIIELEKAFSEIEREERMSREDSRRADNEAVKIRNEHVRGLIMAGAAVGVGVLTIYGEKIIAVTSKAAQLAFKFIKI